MAKRENFYRRDPGAALAGMAGMSLEERGVYNTVIDLLYLTWRPVEDKASYIAGHCGCAVQKLNPILERLIASEKLVRFIEGKQSYISNDAFERERRAVKGAPNTQSGRASVEEKSPSVEEKSAGVGGNPHGCEDEHAQNQPLEALDRVDKSRVEEEKPPNPLKGDEEQFGQALAAYPPRGLENIGHRKLRMAWDVATASVTPDGLLGAVRAFAASDYIQGGGLPRRFDRWLSEGAYAQHLAAPVARTSIWAGPPEIRAAIVAERDEAWARAWLDRCQWRDLPVRLITAKSPTILDRVRKEVGGLLESLGVSIAIIDDERAA